MNKVVLIGRLTKEPELKTTSNDLSVCRFTLAVNRDYQKSEEKQADFINCIAWRNQADNLCRYIHKGGQIAVEGYIKTGSYDDNGVTKYTTDVIANHIEFLESKKSQEQSTYQEHLEQREQRQQQLDAIVKSTNPASDITADDLPF